MTNSDFYCAFAYNSLSVNQDGSIDPCCQYLPDIPRRIKFYDYEKYVATVRQSMHDDQVNLRRHTGCRKCWHEEDLGLKSLRHYANEVYVKDKVTPLVSSDNPITDIELRFGNLCNLKCIMCQPINSSALYSERVMNAELFRTAAVPGVNVIDEKIMEWWETPEFQNFGENLFDHAERINITGGEPFMIPEVVNVLDRLLPRSKDVTISFNTNLTHFPKVIKEKLTFFPKLILHVSLEGVEVMNEYLRYPSKWSVISKNLQEAIDLYGAHHIGVNHTLQHASVYSLPDLVKFCYDFKLRLSFTTVQGIPCLTLDSVPPADLDRFAQYVKTTPYLLLHDKEFLSNVIANTKFDQQKYEDFRRLVSTLDHIRGNSYDNIFTPSTV